MLDRFLVSGDPRQFHNSDAAARVRQSMLKMIFALAGSGELLRAPRRIIPDEWRIGLRPGCDTRWRYLDQVDRR